jgi:hypothetical protein
MRRILEFLDKLEATKRVAVFVLPIVGLSLFILQTEGAEKLGFLNIPKGYVYKFDEILVLILVAVFLLETIQILIGSRIQQVSNLIKPILGFIVSAINLAFDLVYVRPLKFFINPSVKRILRESGFCSVEREFIFRRQKKGSRHDDHYFPEILELNDLTLIKLKIRPRSTGRWRLGFKFSKDKNFPKERYAKNHPLLHLTKDQGSDKLSVHFYKGDSKTPSPHELWTDYNREELTVELRNSGESTSVMIFPMQGGEQYGTLIEKWRYFQLFAWADGVSDFQIDTKIQTITFG